MRAIDKFLGSYNRFSFFIHFSLSPLCYHWSQIAKFCSIPALLDVVLTLLVDSEILDKM